MDRRALKIIWKHEDQEICNIETAGYIDLTLENDKNYIIGSQTNFFHHEMRFKVIS